MPEQNEQPDLEQLKRVVPNKVFAQFKTELESSQGKLLLIWLWRSALLFLLPWRWKFLPSFLRPIREHRQEGQHGNR